MCYNTGVEVKGVSMKNGLMVHGQYPCIRVGKITEALKARGWHHDALSMLMPPQFEEAYDNVIALRNATRQDYMNVIGSHPAAILHAHNEPNWVVGACKKMANGRPVIMNVHDVGSMRGHSFAEDPEGMWREEEAYHLADALVFVNEYQRNWAVEHGIAPRDKRYICLPNYASRDTYVEYYRGKPPLPFIGGLVYAGGIDKRGSNRWRDLSPIADVVDLHIFPGGPGCDYGILHEPHLTYRVLIQELARFDWGLTGVPFENAAWRFSSPNKTYEYFAAGIPVIGMNTEHVKELAKEGLAIHVTSVEELKYVIQEVDPAPFKERVLEQRHRFSMEYNIDELVRLYDELLEGGVTHEGDSGDNALQPARVSKGGPVLGPTTDLLGHRAPRSRRLF